MLNVQPLAERNLRCTFQFPATRQRTLQREYQTGTGIATGTGAGHVARCGMQLSKRKSSPHLQPQPHPHPHPHTLRLALTSVKMIVDSRVRICGLILAYFVTCRHSTLLARCPSVSPTSPSSLVSASFSMPAQLDTHWSRCSWHGGIEASAHDGRVGSEWADRIR